jgi:hypothetical protein
LLFFPDLLFFQLAVGGCSSALYEGRLALDHRFVARITTFLIRFRATMRQVLRKRDRWPPGLFVTWLFGSDIQGSAGIPNHWNSVHSPVFPHTDQTSRVTCPPADNGEHRLHRRLRVPVIRFEEEDLPSRLENVQQSADDRAGVLARSQGRGAEQSVAAAVFDMDWVNPPRQFFFENSALSGRLGRSFLDASFPSQGAQPPNHPGLEYMKCSCPLWIYGWLDGGASPSENRQVDADRRRRSDQERPFLPALPGVGQKETTRERVASETGAFLGLVQVWHGGASGPRFAYNESRNTAARTSGLIL